jgi:hypothetical protein
MTVSHDTSRSPRHGAIAPTPEYLEAYAEADAHAGLPNPRFKQCSIYTSRYLAIRTHLVGIEGLTDAELDLTLF